MTSTNDPRKEPNSVFEGRLNLNHTEPDILVDAVAFRKVVESRRSVRVFQATPIPESVMRDCLDQALLAPNSSNLQTWEFYWVRSEATRKHLNEAFLSQPAVKTCAELVVAVARTGNWRAHSQKMLELLSQQPTKPPQAVVSYYSKLVPFVYTVGPFGILAPFRWLMFAIVGLFKPVPREPAGMSDLKTWAVKSCALACENLMLALRSHGYDSCPMEGMDSARVKKILSLPSDAVVVMGIAAGKRAEGGVYGPRVRFERKLFIKEV